MIIFRQKEFSKMKFPEDWDEDDDKYLKEIDKSINKNMINDAAASAIMGSVPGALETIRTRRFRPRLGVGLPIAGIGFAVSSLLRDSKAKELKNKYRKLKTKKDREDFKRNTELNPGFLKSLSNKSLLAL